MRKRITKPTDRMSTTVNIKVTQREKEIIKDQAEQRGMTVSKLMLSPFQALFAQEGKQ